MSDTEFEASVITTEKIERLRSIFDPERKLETDEDLIELAKYVKNESVGDLKVELDEEIK